MIVTSSPSLRSIASRGLKVPSENRALIVEPMSSSLHGMLRAANSLCRLMVAIVPFVIKHPRFPPLIHSQALKKSSLRPRSEAALHLNQRFLTARYYILRISHLDASRIFVELSASQPYTRQNSKTQPIRAIVYLIDSARCR